MKKRIFAAALASAVLATSVIPGSGNLARVDAAYNDHANVVITQSSTEQYTVDALAWWVDHSYSYKLTGDFDAKISLTVGSLDGTWGPTIVITNDKAHSTKDPSDSTKNNFENEDGYEEYLIMRTDNWVAAGSLLYTNIGGDWESTFGVAGDHFGFVGDNNGVVANSWWVADPDNGCAAFDNKTNNGVAFYDTKSPVRQSPQCSTRQR